MSNLARGSWIVEPDGRLGEVTYVGLHEVWASFSRGPERPVKLSECRILPAPPASTAAESWRLCA